MGYKIIESDDKTRFNLWDSTAETLIALLANRLEKIRHIDKKKVCRELNYTYLRKTNNQNEKVYGPTALQRNILNETGY